VVLKNSPLYFGHIWVLCFVLLLSACAYAPRPSEDAEDIAFQEGESLFQQGATDQALASFSRYLGRYPRGRHAPVALRRIGDIYRSQGANEAAQAFYHNLIAQYPQNPVSDQARLTLIDLYIEEGRSPEAVDIAVEMLEGDLSKEVRQTLYRRLAQLYRVSEDAPHSVLYAYLLYKELPASEKQQWETQLEEAIGRLDGPAIEMVWERIDDPRIRGSLMYRYAMIQVSLANYDDALDLLTAFQQASPDHPRLPEALSRIQSIIDILSFTPHTLGCLLPLSGSHQAYGQRALNAVEMALNLAQTPVPIKLVVEDTASDDTQAVLAVRKLAEAGVGAIIGPIVTAPAAAREAQRLNIPIVTFTQKPDITTIGDYVFRHFITPQNQVKTLVAYFISDLGLRRFAAMYPDDTYGRTFMALFRDEVTLQGGILVAAETYAPGLTDFSNAIKKLVNSRSQKLQGRVERDAADAYLAQDPELGQTMLVQRGSVNDSKVIEVDFDVLFIPDSPNAAGMILPQLVYHDVTGIYTVGTNLWHSRQLIDTAHQYSQNAIMVDGFYTNGQSDAVRNFVDTYRMIFNTEPELMAAFAFDTANILIDLLAQPQMQMRHHLRNQLKQMPQAEGVTGATAFAPDGEAIKRLTLLQIKGDRFIEISRP